MQILYITNAKTSKMPAHIVTSRVATPRRLFLIGTTGLVSMINFPSHPILDRQFPEMQIKLQMQKKEPLALRST